ncbi:sulfotransferase 2A1-like [Sorex araneus]|uniref:sulfotransferase 2A1-like n=1 Tax=Sorex araneus TaxID=42254 RepID=UPI002433DEFD|nr:sulfotransferase 2A1-like [Sorex araneus]
MDTAFLQEQAAKRSDQNKKINGVLFPTVSLTPAFMTEEWHHFLFTDEDVLLLTYPKSGTHWMVEILSLIHCKGDPKWIQSVPIWDRLPWIETERGFKLLKDEKGPRFMRSHLPIQFLPKSFFNAKVKVIYVIRNPRDVIVSGHLFWKGITYVQEAESMEQYFDWFLEGNVLYGSWFDHTHGWMPLRDRENFLLLSYEELKRDTKRIIQKICQFLGMELGPEALDSVLENSSFEAMKRNKMSNYSLLDGITFDLKISPMMRKGVAGDWKNHLTVAQAETFDEIYQEKMKDLPPALFPWD